VIETVIEDLSIKKDVLQHIELAVSTDCIIATNTSGLSINELASSFIKPGRFVGFHFFNPISRMHLIEIIRSKYTRDAIVSSTKEFSKAIGKEPVVCDDRPGFIVNRILMPQLNYAISMVNEGLEPHIIDTAIRLGLNHPMGPLELADMIGLDVCLKTMSSIYQQTGDPRFDPCQLLTKLVDEGKLGRKTKHGFYDYGEKE
jgi:3-hydroxybutyryl-CoA dehydrogenase